MPFLMRCPILGNVRGISAPWNKETFYFCFSSKKKNTLCGVRIPWQVTITWSASQIHLLTHDMDVPFMVVYSSLQLDAAAGIVPQFPLCKAASSRSKGNEAVDLDVTKVYHTLLPVVELIITKRGFKNNYTWTPCQLARCASTLGDPSHEWTNSSQSPAVSLMSPGRWTGPDGHMTAAAHAVFRGCTLWPSPAQCLRWEDFKIPPSSTPTEVDLTRAIKWGSKLSHGFAPVALSQRGKRE